MICEDFIMLGRTVPEPNKDGRVFVCSAGYSPELRSLIRIYPLSRYGGPKRWSMNRIALQRNPKDSRPESWKLAGDTNENHNQINMLFNTFDMIRGQERHDILDVDQLWVNSIKEANERRLSLALIEPKGIPSITYDENPNSPDHPQMKLFDEGLPETEGAKRFPYQPRMQFDDDKGSHKLMLRDWGCYERMRKAPGQFDLNECLSLGRDSRLLIGNLNSHRTSWLVISVLNIGMAQLSILDGAA
jgi:hypothetical protein